MNTIITLQTDDGDTGPTLSSTPLHVALHLVIYTGRLTAQHVNYTKILEGMYMLVAMAIRFSCHH